MTVLGVYLRIESKLYYIKGDGRETVIIDLYRQLGSYLNTLNLAVTCHVTVHLPVIVAVTVASLPVALNRTSENCVAA